MWKDHTIDVFAPSCPDKEEGKLYSYNTILVDPEDDPYAGGFQVIWAIRLSGFKVFFSEMYYAGIKEG